MRYSAIFLLGAALFSCGPGGSQLRDDIRPIPADTGVFTLRFNPVKSLAGRPELSLEMSFGKHWERVAIVADDGAELVVKQLLESVTETPEGVVKVSGELTDNTVNWGQGHSSRVLEIDAIMPTDRPVP